MAAGTIAGLTGLMKNVYDPLIQKQINENAGVLSYLPRVTSSVTKPGGTNGVVYTAANNQWKFALQTKNAYGYGSRAEDETLPTAADPTIVQGSAAPRYHYFQIRITRPLLQLAKGDQASFANALNVIMESNLTTFKRDKARQLMSDGTGIIFVTGSDVAASTSEQTFLVKTDENVRIPASRAKTAWVEVGMPVTVWNDAGTQKDAVAGVVTTVTEGTSIGVTWASNPTASSGDIHYFSIYGNTDYSSGWRGREMGGFAGMCLNTTVAGLTRASYPALSSYTESVTTMDELALMKACREPKKRVGKKTDLILTTWGVMNSLFSQLQDLRSWSAPSQVQLTGGYSALRIMVDGDTVDLVREEFCPSGCMYGINREATVLAETAPMGWVDDDGTTLLREATDSFAGRFAWYANLIEKCPAANWFVYGITEA